MSKSIINWRALSLMVAKNSGSIRENSCPKKYEKPINNLVQVLEEWENVHLKGKEPIKRYTKEEVIVKVGSVSWEV